MSTTSLFNKEFRIAVLYLLCSDVKFSDRFLPILEQEYFSEQSLQFIFKAIKNIRDFKPEIQEISKQVIRTELYEILSQLGVPFDLVEEDVELIFTQYIDDISFIKDKLINWIRRERVLNALRNSVEYVKANNIDKVKIEVEKAFDINVGDDLGIIFDEDVEDKVDEYKNKYRDANLIKTGFKTLDRVLLGGMGAGECHTIIAPPKIGKSTIAVNIGYSVLMQRFAVVHITLELSEIDVFSKYACLMTDYTYKDLLKMPKEEIMSRLNLFRKTYDPKLFIKYYPNKTITTENIKSYISSLRAERKIDRKIGLIIVDYDDLLLPTSGSKDMYEASGDIYFDLVKLANYFDCPVLTLSQPKREAWAKAYQGELISGGDVSHSAKKIHNAFSIITLNKTSSNSYKLLVDLVRRGESGVSINLDVDLSKARIVEKV